MQILKVNSNQNYKTNQNTSFKGQAEQKMVVDAFANWQEKAFAGSDVQKGVQPVVEFFMGALGTLKEGFLGKGFKVSGVMDTDIFKRVVLVKPAEGTKAEEIDLRLYNTSKKGPKFRYLESQISGNGNGKPKQVCTADMTYSGVTA